MIPQEEVLAPLWPHLEACAPAEGCAVLLAGPAGHRLRLVRNAAAGVGQFALDDDEWWALLREADVRGERIQWLIHSHVELPPALSAEDRAAARLHPGVDWLVVSLKDGQVDACALHPSASESRVSKGLGPR